MKKKPLISVIIPVYNVEKYLLKCLTSISNQTYDNIEVILVDDGSTDSSGNICDEYSKKYHFNVIHKQNAGLSSARNVGIEKAIGEYIAFIDSDDFISIYFFEIIVKILEKTNADVVALRQPNRFWDGDDDRVVSAVDGNDYTVDLMSKDVALKEMFYLKIATGAQFKVCRKCIFDGIRFPEGYLYEDIATTYKELLLANRIAVASSNMYAYRKRMDGIIRQDFTSKKLCIIDISQQLLADIKKEKKKLVPAAKNRVFSAIFGVFLQVPENDIVSQKKLWKEIVRYRGSILLNIKNGRIKDKIAAVVTFGGMKFSHKVGRKHGQKGTMYK